MSMDFKHKNVIHRIFLLSVLAALPAFAASKEGIGAPTEAENAALAILNDCARAPSLLNTFVLTADSSRNGSHFHSKQYVLNARGILRSRIELTATSPKGPPSTQITISTPEGVWRSLHHRWAKLSYESNVAPLSCRFHPPSIIDAGLQLGLANHKTVYELENDVTYHGKPCVRVTASLEPMGMDELSSHPEVLEKKLDDLLNEVPTDPHLSKGEKSAQLLAVKRVFWVEPKTHFLLSMRSYSVDGLEFTHFEYSDFHASEPIPDDLFHPPSDAIISEAKSPAEYKALLRLDQR